MCQRRWMTQVHRPQIRLNAAVLNAPDARALASFYEQLLGWQRDTDKPEWVTLRPPKLATGLSFQTERDFVPPVWPSEPGELRMMVHLDIAVDDLEAGVAWALELGARVSDVQTNENWRVLLDPAGHPFCLFVGAF